MSHMYKKKATKGCMLKLFSILALILALNTLRVLLSV